MMETVIDIPVPAPEDSETVAAALETAAVYGARGDATEALRWLKRAAESAGDSGDDVRTLSLARLAADISTQLQQGGSQTPPARQLPKPPPRSPRTPPPPPRSGSPSPTAEPRTAEPQTTESQTAESQAMVPASGADSSAAEAIGLLPRSVPPPLPRMPVQKAEPVEAAPDAPPVRRYALPSSHPSSLRSRRARTERTSDPSETSPESGSTGATSEPVGEASQPESARGGTSISEPTLAASAQEVQAGSVAKTPSVENDPIEIPASASSMSGANAPEPESPRAAHESESSLPTRAVVDDAVPPAETVANSSAATASELPVEAGSEDSEPESLREPSRETNPGAEASGDAPRLRKAARVSVVPSLIEPGLFLVRLLDEEGQVPNNAAEGLLVVMDPETEVFRRSSGQYLDRNH